MLTCLYSFGIIHLCLHYSFVTAVATSTWLPQKRCRVVDIFSCSGNNATTFPVSKQHTTTWISSCEQASTQSYSCKIFWFSKIKTFKTCHTIICRNPTNCIYIVYIYTCRYVCVHRSFERLLVRRHISSLMTRFCSFTPRNVS